MLLLFLPIPPTESAWRLRYIANARVRIPHPKIEELALQAQGVGIFAAGEIPGHSNEVLFSFSGDPSAHLPAPPTLFPSFYSSKIKFNLAKRRKM